MSVLNKLKSVIESNAWFEDGDYNGILISIIHEFPNYPKVEIDGDTSDDLKFVTSDNYNEEKYELLDTENFEIVSADDDEVVICAGGDWQTPLTFTIKEVGSKLVITDIYSGFSDGLSIEEFNDILRNL